MKDKTDPKVAIIGAGIGGLAAALALSAAGYEVEVVEAAAAPGGKLRQVSAGGRLIDAGPTVLTMKWVFDALFQRLGMRFEDEVRLERSNVIARHYWDSGERLDLFADLGQSHDAIAEFAGRKEAEGFIRFARDSRRTYEVLKDSFINAPRPNPLSLTQRIGFTRPGELLAIKPFSMLWSALGGYFSDPRLRQLFGRYATYCGSSPYLSPATLMLVAHVEQAGVWILPDGMHALAVCLARLAEARGAVFRYGDPVEKLLTDGRQVTGVRTRSGREIAAGSVIYNGDVSALGHLMAGGPKPVPAKKRSLSALVTCGMADVTGVPLAHHTVFFSNDYKAEFDAILGRRQAPQDPTVYVCAEDRRDDGTRRDGGSGAERFYGLVNLPADGDQHTYSESEIERCLDAMDRRLQVNGVSIRREPGAVVTGPDRFSALFPGAGGALYGMASHGWMASFSRMGSRGPVAGLYLAGGSVHPGPGVPMAAISGRLAADRLMADQALTGRSRPPVINGGMPTASAIAGDTPSR